MTNPGPDPNTGSDQLRNFTGRVPLFPLPDAVLFPHGVIQLLVFEPRYRKMVEDSLARDRLIAMALLAPGWEATYESKSAPIHQTVCIGRIASWELLDDGRYQIALEGLARGIVLDEDHSTLPYRVARIELRSDMPSGLSSEQRRRRQRELLVGFQQAAAGCDFDESFHNSLDADLPLGGLCDVIAFSLALGPDVAQAIFEEPDIANRSLMVLGELKHCITSSAENVSETRHNQTFPPPYSLN